MMSNPTNTELYLKMRELHPEWNDTQIAKEVGITRERARQIRNNLGLPPSANYRRRAKSKRRLLVEEYLQSGQYGSDANTGNKYNMTTGSIRLIRIELGLPVRIKIGLPKSEKRLQIEEYLKQGTYLSDRHTAQMFNAIPSWIAEIRWGLDLPSYQAKRRG